MHTIMIDGLTFTTDKRIVSIRGNLVQLEDGSTVNTITGQVSSRTPGSIIVNGVQYGISAGRGAGAGGAGSGASGGRGSGRGKSRQRIGVMLAGVAERQAADA